MTGYSRAVGASLLFALLALLAGTALARDFRVDPGEVPELRPGEGFLVVALDSDQPVRSLHFRAMDSVFTGGRLYRLPEGSTLALYVVPAGRYRWEQVSISWARFSLRDDLEARFDVVAGRVNYPGDLVYRNLITRHFANRGLRAMDWLQAEHPEIARRYEFAYSGMYPDPFPAFLRGITADTPRPPQDVHLPAPAPGPLPLPVRELWKESQLESIALSPGGRWAASAIHAGEDDYRLEVIDLDAETASTAVTSLGAITNLRWIADDILAAYVQTLGGYRTMFIRFADGAAPVAFTMPRPGVVVDGLAGDEDDVVFGSFDARGRFMLHRIDARDPEYLRRWAFATRERLNTGLEHDERWFVDGTGAVRAALVVRLVKDADGVETPVQDLVWRPDPKAAYAPVLTLDDDDGFHPLAMSADGALIYGTIETGRAQRELVTFDPVRREIVATLFSRPGIDVVSGLFDDRRAPVGAAYYEGGHLVSEYFDEDGRSLTAGLGRAFRDRTVAVLGRDRDGRRLLLLVDGADQPPQVYLLDRDTRQASLLEETAPWLSGKAFAPATALRVPTGDGLEIEAFLTLPPGEGPRPLVLMPHGGPVGVADRLHFDPEVQFIASLGYAVLQVNFRGSEGYGTRFREAGHRGLGTVIEDDIEAALAAALAKFPLDPERICVVGTSYGGYSGLSLAVRRPGRFRCVVSIAGVSDRALFFTASDSGRSAQGRAELERIVGDPATEMDRLIATSPLFQYRDLTTPVMLVHGHEDIRVDFEHTRRLVRMLNLAGRPPVVLEFEDEGHGVEDIDNIETTWHAVAGFLRRHLEGIEAAPAAAGAKDAAVPETAPAAAAD